MRVRTPSPYGDVMTGAQLHSQFLVEWYWPASTALVFDDAVTHLVDLAATTEAAVEVLVTVLVEADEVAFGIFDAHSETSVKELCSRAGVPAQRLTPAVDIRFPSAGRGG
jgi:hypothetical protein